MVQYANHVGLLTSLPTVEQVLDDHASELRGATPLEHKVPEMIVWQETADTKRRVRC
jgi:hypothetical protein